MPDPSSVATFLFTDIEGSSRLWDTAADRMKGALARHDAVAREVVEANGGRIVKTTGDGIHAVFEDPAGGVAATVAFLRALRDPAATDGTPLKVRCGLHAGVTERRDGDFYGGDVNRAARIMSIAHGGQAIISQSVADLVRDRLPDGITLLDLGTVRLRDLSRPERVYQLLHPALPREFPALRSLESTPNNLPQQLTTFIGREREMKELHALLASSRLVTLFGAGGLGKTRLSLQVAADALVDYPDGVWLVELASLNDAANVVQAVASALGVREEAGRPLVDALVEFLKSRRLLLILDNCEHVVAGCAQLARTLLQAGDGVRILASSRETLQVAGESVYQVSPLAIPRVDNRLVADALEQYEAARLFVERVKAVRPGFRPNDATARLVGEICTRLDGIPLAIELAAARTRSMSVEAIAARLSDRFALLTGGDRTAMPRQQTLRALIDWSFDLLSEKERALFRRLSVFAGGWALESAEQVCAHPPVDAAEVLDRLADLVDKSLVIFDGATDRYRMLDTVREYALDRLEEAGETALMRSRHLAYHARLLEIAYDELWDERQGEWLARLDAERENVLAAHAACDDVEGGDRIGLDLAFRTKPYWINRGLLGLGHRLTDEAIRRLDQTASAELSRGLYVLGELCFFMGRYREALEHLERCLASAREAGDRRMEAGALNTLSMASIGCGDLPRARSYGDQGLMAAREMDDRRLMAAHLVALAQLDRTEGDLDAAEARYGEALAITRELGDAESQAVTLLNIAMAAVERGATARAAEALRQAVGISIGIGSSRLGQSALDVASGLAAELGDWRRAARLSGASDAEMEETGLQREPADDAFLRPRLARTQESLGATAFADEAAKGRRTPYLAAISDCATWLEGIGQPDKAERPV